MAIKYPDISKAELKQNIIDNLMMLYREIHRRCHTSAGVPGCGLRAEGSNFRAMDGDSQRVWQTGFQDRLLYVHGILMGRALGNNLINLKAYKEVKEVLDELGFDMNVIEDEEPDAALGNGGLGRALCFLDSLSPSSGIRPTAAVSGRYRLWYL